jgi:outer membrane lipoprotein-sorting protein
MKTVLLRWLPAVVVPAVIATVAVAAPFQVSATEDLPAKTPEQVVSLALNSSVSAFSGTLEQTSELGLPQLPAGEKFSDSPQDAVIDLLTGSHTARVYVDGPTKSRIQVMDTLAERDIIRSGTDAWLYDSGDNSTVHMTLPQNARHGTHEGQTPANLAQKLLNALDSSTRVTVGDDTEVAGRTAYELMLTPRTTDTLVGSVAIAVDSQTGLPLSVDVRARGQHAPAFHLAFTDLTLKAPDADRFSFTPPPGSDVKEFTVPGHKNPGEMPRSAKAMPQVTGTGWSAIVELPAGTVPKELTASPLLSQLTTPVASGRLLSSSLVNILLTNDGRVFAGSVPADLLTAAAAR